MTQEEMKLLLEASDRELFAVKSHLEDMRRLVFEGLMPNILPILPQINVGEKK